MKDKLNTLWAIAWRTLAALLVQSFIQVKVISKKVERRWDIQKCEHRWPESVSIEYKYKGRWYSPVTWIIIIIHLFMYIFDGGLKEFYEDVLKDCFKYGNSRTQTWTYKETYNCSKFRLWLDSFVLIRMEA